MKKIFLLPVLAILMSGCATILTGTKDIISFNSYPSGAIVFKDGLELCKTPCSVPVKRSLFKENIEFKLDGYETRLFSLDKEFNAVCIVNLGSVFGWAIDAATGSLMKYDRKHYDLEMKMEKYAGSENLKEIRIDTKNKTVDLFTVYN